MCNYQRTSTSRFICHFALINSNIWSVWAEILYWILHTRSRSGAKFNPIRPKHCWSSGGPSSLQMTLFTEEHGGGLIIQMVICDILCSSIPLILMLAIWRTVLFAKDHLQRNGGLIVARNNCREEQLSRGTIVAWNNCREEQLSRGTLSWGNLLRGTLRDLVILGQYSLVLFGIKT